MAETKDLNEDLITCQIIFYPLATTEVTRPVNEVIDIIKSYSLQDIEVGPTSTILRGSRDKIYTLLNNISAEMEKQDIKYAMSINISNECGC